MGSEFIVTAGKELLEFFAAQWFFLVEFLQDNCSESGSLHAVPKQSCCDRKVSHLCLYCSGAEEMAVEQVDCFNYAGNGPWGFWSGNPRTSKSFQKHPNLEHTTFLVNLQRRAARSCRMLLKPTCCKCAFFLVVIQCFGSWRGTGMFGTECTAQASVAGAELGLRLSRVLIK